ncbi:serine hydrolase [uncultured Paraglaciecola sp.]|uniref:serine hydrolase n=1 Tax=uncultured Paraglaciecola sp. TaxID=1765024 RepID=UPI0030DBFD5E|tara:strand:+ start:32932 stop:34593 length:1662 start_codon:yes stop_codon:yes gene_type:complete
MQPLVSKLLVIFLIITTQRVAPVLANIDTESIQEIIKLKLEKQKSAVGVSIAIIENGNIEYLSFGVTEQGNKTPVTAATLFEIGSISKTFTSMALASMVTEGRVKLSDPVQQYLPKSVKMPTKNGKTITLLSLANHMSGLPRLPDNMPFGDPADPYADYTLELLYEFLNSYELTREIDAQLEYSNLAVGLLGHILELIDNKTYQQVIYDRVFSPLGLASSFVDVPESHKALLSNGHDAGLNVVKHWQLPALAGAGAIKSNIKDMAQYLKANLNPEFDFVKLTHKQTTGGDNEGPKVGLAWFTSEHDKGSYLWHNGGTGGFRSFMGVDQTNNKGIVILENTANGLDALGNAYLQGTLAQLRSDILNVKMVDERKLARLNGEYELAPGLIMAVSNQAQQLFVQVTGQTILPVTAKSDIEFVQTAVGAKIIFELNDKGEVPYLTLEQAGRKIKALKLDPNRPNEHDNKVTLTQTELDNLNGIYELSSNFAITITNENAQLIIQATSQPKIPFETKSKSEFSNAMVQARIVFELDAAGKATSLTLFQSGQALKGLKK